MKGRQLVRRTTTIIEVEAGRLSAVESQQGVAVAVVYKHGVVKHYA